MSLVAVAPVESGSLLFSSVCTSDNHAIPLWDLPCALSVNSIPQIHIENPELHPNNSVFHARFMYHRYLRRFDDGSSSKRAAVKRNYLEQIRNEAYYECPFSPWTIFWPAVDPRYGE